MGKICIKCNKEFKTPSKKQKYCSSDCYHGIFVPAVTQCKFCGKDYLAIGKVRKSNPSVFCSSECRTNSRFGKTNPNYKTGETVTYYPSVRRGDRKIGVHRLIVEEAIGRPLQSQEHVHHINGNKSDNRVENLELWSTSHPYGQRVQDKIEWAVKFLEYYGFTVIKSTRQTNGTVVAAAQSIGRCRLLGNFPGAAPTQAALRS